MNVLRDIIIIQQQIDVINVIHTVRGAIGAGIGDTARVAPLAYITLIRTSVVVVIGISLQIIMEGKAHSMYIKME